MGRKLPKPYDEHHVLFYRRAWESNPCGKQLRRQDSLIVPMKKRIHEELHNDVLGVPLLHPHLAQLVLSQFKSRRKEDDDHIKSIGHLMDALSVVNKSELLVDRDRVLGRITLEAIEAQIPYIKRGLLVVPDVVLTPTYDLTRP